MTANTTAAVAATIAIMTGDSRSAGARAIQARRIALAPTTACTSAPMPSRIDTAYMNGGSGQRRMSVVRPCCARLSANTQMRQVRIANRISSSTAPSASSQAATRPVNQRARISTLRLTPPASPAGMQAATATANATAVISFNAVIAVPASQRISTSTTVTAAAPSMPSTPMKAIGRDHAVQICSARSRSETGAGGDVASVTEASAIRLPAGAAGG